MLDRSFRRTHHLDTTKTRENQLPDFSQYNHVASLFCTLAAFRNFMLEPSIEALSALLNSPHAVQYLLAADFTLKNVSVAANMICEFISANSLSYASLQGPVVVYNFASFLHTHQEGPENLTMLRILHTLLKYLFRGD